jgi:hypothetical protein
MDRLRKAYATLGLAPGASSRDARKRYKVLVKRWHPDRFTRDPQGQAEAARQMREINDAYQAIRSAEAPAPRTQDPEASQPDQAATPPRGRRLSRAEIETLVTMLQNPSPVDMVREFLDWTWPILLAVVMVGPIRAALGTGGGLLFFLACLGLAVLLRRRRVGRRNP